MSKMNRNMLLGALLGAALGAFIMHKVSG